MLQMGQYAAAGRRREPPRIPGSQLWYFAETAEAAETAEYSPYDRASFSTIHVHMANVLSWAGERSEPGFS